MASSNPPKILLAKPISVPAVESVVLRSRLPPLPSLNLLSDSWDFHTDRILPFLSENTDFTVIGVIGPPGAGKSTILNELYGFDGSSPGMLPPFTTQSEETRAMARHCTAGIELRVSAERLILLDTQPIFSPSVLAEMMRPDGSSTVSVLSGESMSADLAHELMGIQLGVFLASICHVLLVVSEGVHDISMWHLMLTVDLLKHGIPDPSLLMPPYSQNSIQGQDKENSDNLQETNDEFLAAPLFVHTKVQDQFLCPRSIMQLKKALTQYLDSSSFSVMKGENETKKQMDSSGSPDSETGYLGQSLFLLPLRAQDDSQRAQYVSYISMLGRLRNQILSMNCRTFAKTVSERDWLRNSARIWEIVKKSPVIADYSRTLQSSGLFRRI
ncbi:uncharacterized protein LOC143861701 isoform X4 [Tasmannia lanceolata]|uniref:uncharacterized protein LOC143861701 isoform X4 n=1 Tax=Tasmannia lanceolata TaxID=3420 RepID=UPI0040639F69